jgi:predicted site-specific integrase-resolvase
VKAKEIKLSEYAKMMHRCYRTMWNKFHAGEMPNAYADEHNSIYVRIGEDDEKEKNVVIYCRVSSHDQKADLDRQIERLSDFTIRNGYVINRVYKEIASGLNDKRKELQKILEDEKITTIIVENKDRLTRFGFNYIETLLKRNGVSIVVASELDDTNKNDLIQDFVSVITSFCARIYGQRRSKNNVKKLLKELE